MQLPLTDADTLFAELLQDLPPETAQMARDFKAFVRAKKVKTPTQLVRMVLLYCGLDKTLREVAGTWTALYEPITDQSVAERLRACRPWVHALLQHMFPPAVGATLPQTLRFLVIDGSSIQAPGATGTDYRLHIMMDLRTLVFVEVLITDVHTGETLKHFTLGASDVAVADRGYAQAQGLHETVQRGAAVIVRLNPFSVVLLTTTGTPLSLPEALKRQPQATIRTLEVVLQGSGGQPEVRGWMQAYRLNAEQASQAAAAVASGIKRRPDRRQSVPRGLGPRLYHAGAYHTDGAGDHGPVSLPLASGTRDKTMEKSPGCGCCTGQSHGAVGGRLAPWQAPRCLDAGTAHAAQGRRRLELPRSRAGGHVVAGLGHA